MRARALALAALLLLAPAAAASAVLEGDVGASPTVPAPAPETNGPDTSQTRCGITVCATSAAFASPVCTKPTASSAQCTAAGAIGGHGVSPTFLPGNVRYWGTLTCSGDCASTSTSASGSIGWNAVDADGAGQQSAMNLGTRIKWNPFFVECLHIRVTAIGNAEATTTAAGVPIERVPAPQSFHSVSASACT